MQAKQTAAQLVALQNEVLLLAEGKKRTGEQLAQVKDLMRKLREGELKVTDSVYCFSNGVASKQKTNQLYPFLEKRTRALNKQKIDWQAKLQTQLQAIATLLKQGRINGSSVDSRVGEMLREWQLQQQD